ncbi:MAG: 50S ribosomal protein L37ae [Candidatus Bathyarchaeia archaeon]
MVKRSSALFGTKYGFTVRKRAAEVSITRRTKYRCPSCERNFLQRVAVGIWRCRGCGYTFAGGAYNPFTKVGQAAVRSLSTKS